MKIINVKKIEDMSVEDFFNGANLDYPLQIKNICEFLKEPVACEDSAMAVFISYYQNVHNHISVDIYPTFFVNKQLKKTSLQIQESCNLGHTFVKSSLCNDTTVPELKDDNARCILSAHMYAYFIQVEIPAKEMWADAKNNLFDNLHRVVKAQTLKDELPNKPEKNKKVKI